ncbi:hypothetical protein FRC17_010439 [Serendipita sp. 399]|nr:hypothetical protein FRC17_010439 [Serendipita sp. 399]
MAQVPAASPLQVRDARTVSNRADLKELRNFFDSAPITSFPAASSPPQPTKKLSKSRSLFSIGKKERVNDTGSISVSENSEKLVSQPVGTLARKVGDHTVYMLAATGQTNYSRREGSFATLPSRPVHLSQQTRSASYSHPPLAVSTPRRPPILTTQSETNVNTTASGRFTITVTRSSDEETTKSDLSGEISSMKSPFITSTSYGSLSPVPELASLDSHVQAWDNHSPPHMTLSMPNKILRDACVQTDDQPKSSGTVNQTLAQPLTGISGSTDVLKDISFPLTPPPSLSSMNLQAKFPICESPPQPTSQKRRRRKKKLVKVPLDPIQYTMTHNHVEILDLEVMEDKEQAFEQLVEMYKQHKFLRDAEEELHQQRLGDVSAGLVAQKMVILKLVDMLRERGVSMQEIQATVGAYIDADISSNEPIFSPRNSPDLTDIDASRFHMLRKEKQLDRIRDFQASQYSYHCAEPAQVLDGSPIDKQPRFKTLQELPTPVPTQPLPPIPMQRSSMFVHRSSMMASPVVRSKSLTENAGHTFDSDSIDERMRRLESAFSFSHSGKASESTLSLSLSPNRHIELASLLEEDSSEPNSDSRVPLDSRNTDSTRDEGNDTNSSASSYSDLYSCGLNISVDSASNAPFMRLKSGDSSSASSLNPILDTMSGTPVSSGIRPRSHPRPQAPCAGGDLSSLTDAPASGPSRRKRGSLPAKRSPAAGECSTNSKSPSLDEATWSSLLLGLVKSHGRNTSGTP